MDQQLNHALELHKKGDTKEALVKYEEILKRIKPPLVSFLNASSIWRRTKASIVNLMLKKRSKLLSRGSRTWNNLGNCYLDNNNTLLAISSYRQALTFRWNRRCPYKLASRLRELGKSISHMPPQESLYSKYYKRRKNAFNNTACGSDNGFVRSRRNKFSATRS